VLTRGLRQRAVTELLAPKQAKEFRTDAKIEGKFSVPRRYSVPEEDDE